MGRLFWRFFLAIWLAIAGAIVSVVLINNIFNVLPPRGDDGQHRGGLARETIAQLINDGKQDEALVLARAINTLNPPIKVVVTRVVTAEANQSVDAVKLQPPVCQPAEPPPPGVSFAGFGDSCYRVEQLSAPPTFIETYLPPALPFISAMMASLLVAWILAEYLVAPVSLLRDGLSALAKGIFSVRIGAAIGNRTDEIAALGKDFDVTAAKLQELQDGQKRLFHDVSHELRSPLTRLQAALGIVRRNQSKLSSILPRMDREIERMDSMIEEILTLARVGAEEGQWREYQTIDIIDLLGAIIEDAAFEADPRGITIEYAGIVSFVCRVNGELIYRALENVIRNAVKYTDDRSMICVKAEMAPSEDALRVSVRDHGPGVSESELERIFAPFARLMENDAAPGHGLGLAITRRAIEHHGGRVWAETNGPRGLAVLIEIPSQPIER
jgi:two-component system, OmpR family, sensor kinase